MLGGVRGALLPFTFTFAKRRATHPHLYKRCLPRHPRHPLFIMPDKASFEKQEYFRQQEPLDLFDDEMGLSEMSLAVGRAIMDSRVMPPLLDQQRSSFLGLTPREKRAQFEAYTLKKRASARPSERLRQSTTEPCVDIVRRFPSAESNEGLLSTPKQSSSRKRLKHKTPPLDPTLFYRRVGVIPRELTGGKNARPAMNIQLVPEARRLLRGKIVCTLMKQAATI